MRPWLYTIARNRCLTMLVAAQAGVGPADEVEPAVEGLAAAVEQRADLRALLGDISRLPEDQRSALVLSELADLSHAEIADVIDVPRAKVKALVHQARTRLLAERDARELPCEQVREQLSTASGGELRRGPLRRHLSHCEGCRAYRDAVRDQHVALGLVLPVLPSAGLKEAILGTISGGGAGGAAAVGGAALSGGGTVGMAAKGIGAKLAIGAALAGGAGGGAVAVKQAADEPRAPVTPARVVRATTPAPPVRDKATERQDRAEAEALRTAARERRKPDKTSARQDRADAKALRTAARERRKAARMKRAKRRAAPGRSKQAERRAGTPAKAKRVKAVRAKPVKPLKAKAVKPFTAKPVKPFTAKPVKPFTAKPFNATPAGPVQGQSGTPTIAPAPKPKHAG